MSWVLTLPRGNMTIEIKNRWSGRVLYTSEAASLRDAVIEAVGKGANLSAADLSAANLSAANLSAADLSAANLSAADLSEANLREANLRAADLSEANLSAADLSEANLREANLSAADLREANLREANLREANLREANLSAADLREANLREANLRAANLRAAENVPPFLAEIRDDVFRILDRAPHEVPGLLRALNDGRINGSVYEGECACLIGTIANVRGCNYQTLGEGLRPDSSRPAEVFFLRLRQGHTPANSESAAIAAGWIREWMMSHPEPLV